MGGVLDRKQATLDAGYRKALGFWDLTGIGLAAIIGAGIFFLLAGEAQTAGPAVVISIVVAGLAAILAAFSYAEFSSVMPGNGSAYAYAYAAFGRFPAFLMGWLFINAYAIGNSGVAIAWSEFFVAAMDGLGWTIPHALAVGPAEGGLINLPAVLLTILVTFVVLRGIQESTRINNLLVVLKLAIVALVIILGAFYVDPANWQPFAPGGMSAVVSGTAVLFFAYLGFDTIAAAGAEAKNPQRDLPRAIMTSLVGATLLYIAMALVFTGMGGGQGDGTKAAMAAAFADAGQPWAAWVITIGVLIALATVLYAFHQAMARIFQAMGQDGFMPKSFGRVSKRGVPAAGTWAVAVLAGVPAAFIDLANIIDMAVAASILIYAAVAVGVIALRRVHPVRGSFRVPAWLHVVTALVLLAISWFGLGVTLNLLMLAWVALGMMVYGFWAHRASVRADVA